MEHAFDTLRNYNELDTAQDFFADIFTSGTNVKLDPAGEKEADTMLSLSFADSDPYLPGNAVLKMPSPLLSSAASNPIEPDSMALYQHPESTDISFSYPPSSVGEDSDSLWTSDAVDFTGMTPFIQPSYNSNPPSRVGVTCAVAPNMEKKGRVRSLTNAGLDQIPNEYWEKRIKNNDAVRRSRQRKKEREQSKQKEYATLEQKYTLAEKRIHQLERELAWEKRKNEILTYYNSLRADSQMRQAVSDDGFPQM